MPQKNAPQQSRNRKTESWPDRIMREMERWSDGEMERWVLKERNEVGFRRKSFRLLIPWFS